MKIFSYIKAFLSLICFGLGQLLNKQFWKGLFFLTIFSLFIGIELSTSKYGQEISPYDKIEAPDIDNNVFKNYYDYNITSEKFVKLGVKGYVYDSKLTEYYNEVTNNGENLEAWNQENVIKYLARNLKEASPNKYIDAFSNKTYTEEEFKNEILENVVSTPTNFAFYMDGENNFYQEFIKVEENNLKYLKKVNPITGEILGDEEFEIKKEYVKYLKGTNLARDKENNIYFEIKEYKQDGNFGETYYLKAIDQSIFKETEGNKLSKKIDNTYYLYISKDLTKVYRYYEAGMFANGSYIPYESNEATLYFKQFLKWQFSQISNQVTNVQVKKFFLRTYFELDPQLKTDFETRFNNFYFDKAGLFVRSYWAVLTLGETSTATYTEYQSLFNALKPADLVIEGNTILMGHVSVQVLLEGLIGVILSIFFFIFGIWSASDAYKVSNAKIKKEEVLNTKEYFKSVYEESFEYIVLFPAIFVLAFISIMPIIFGFILAFTSVSGGKSMIECFDWVGLQNFKNLFNFSSGLGSSFGTMFWKVLGWTIVWAIFSTATVFFGGLFQALILNSEHVVFRKLWRSILILPWAIPAILSQMVFSVMFKETGYVNAVIENLGLYEVFRNWGILGSQANPIIYSELSWIKKIFYLGPEHIKWFTNTDNITFVRTTLIVVNIWLGFPYFMALMSGVMTSIDKSLYEAAEIDGATKMQQIKLITFPLVLYSTAPILIMNFSGNFNNFGVIYFITQGGPNNGFADRAFAGSTDILISWMYKLTVDHSVYNMASVFSVLIFLFVGSITAWNLTKTRAFQED